MIDIQTIKFIEFLNKMARKSEEGFYPFSTATENTGILFDDENKLSRGHRIICDCLMTDDHHDIVSTYTDIYNDYGVTAVVITEMEDDDIEPYIEITFNDNNACIVIEDVKWYFA